MVQDARVTEARTGPRELGVGLLGVAGGTVFLVAMFLPYLTQGGPVPRDVAIIEVSEGFRVWGPLALAPAGVPAVAVTGAVLLVGGRWTPRRSAGLLIGAGLWATLRGVSLVGVAVYPGGTLGSVLEPAIGSFLALSGGVMVLAAGLVTFAGAPDETGARSRFVAGLQILASAGYVVAAVIPAARQAAPGVEALDLTLVNLDAPEATLLWEALLPGAVTIALLLAAMRILTGTAGGTGAMVMALGVVTTLQFGGIIAWATRSNVFLSPAPGGFLGLGTGLLLLVAGLLAPAGAGRSAGRARRGPPPDGSGLST